MQNQDQQKGFISQKGTLSKMTINLNVNKQNPHFYSQINEEYFSNIFKQHLVYDCDRPHSRALSQITEPTRRLKKPSSSQSKFEYVWPFHYKIRNIMGMAYNKGELTRSDFHSLQELFKLDQNKIKMINCPDPIVLQILRYAIYNKQQIPSKLVEVVNQMAHTNMVKQWEPTFDIIHKVFMFELVSEIFQPPLDLYIDFVETGLIVPSFQELNQVLTRNQYFYKIFCNNKESYSTISQKKRLILNQFPYLLDIINRVKQESSFNFVGFKLYLKTILDFLKFYSEDCLLDRYLPEVRCLYLSARSNLTISDIQFLFLTLKSISSLSINDFHTLYSTKNNKPPVTRPHQTKSWIKFWKFEELCSNILSKKDFHLTQKQIQQMCEQLNFQNPFCPFYVRYHLILVMLLEQSYHNNSFSKKAIKNIEWIFKNIPDKKKKKQCCYILLFQYFKLIEQNPDKRQDMVKLYTFPEQQIDHVLDGGRQMALDLLLAQEDKDLFADETKYLIYVKIVKKLIMQTKNKSIKLRALQLQKKLNSKTNIQSEQIINIEKQNLLVNNELIYLLQIEALNGKKLQENYIKNIIQILKQNNNPQIRKKCLSTINYLIGNSQKGQLLPVDFEKNIVQIICCQNFFDSIPEECRIQTLSLIIQITNLPGSYAFIENITKFLFKIYTNSQPNTFWNVNSSYGLCSIVLHLKQQNVDKQNISRDFLSKFSVQIFKKMKNNFDLAHLGSSNILCLCLVLAKNQVQLPIDLAEHLTVIGLKQKQFTEIALLTVFYFIQNSKLNILFERIMLNICKILKQNKNNQIVGVYILQLCYNRQKSLPNNVIKKIRELKGKSCQSKSCERLCSFYKNYLKKETVKTNLQ